MLLEAYRDGRFFIVFLDRIHVIFNVLSGAIYEDDALRLKSIVQEIFIETPFDSIILGCTELPLLHKKYPFLTDGGIPVIDTLAVLARELAHISIDF